MLVEEQGFEMVMTGGESRGVSYLGMTRGRELIVFGARLRSRQVYPLDSGRV